MVDGQNLGIGIDGELSVGGEDADAGVARQADRQSVEFGAGLRQRGANGVHVRLLDLSTHGFRAETHLDLLPGMVVWLKLPRIETQHARVAWSRNFLVGCQFVRPLHPAVLDMIVRSAH